VRAGGRLWVPVEVSPAIRVAQGQAEQAAKSLSRGGGGSSRRVICVARGVAWRGCGITARIEAALVGRTFYDRQAVFFLNGGHCGVMSNGFVCDSVRKMDTCHEAAQDAEFEFGPQGRFAADLVPAFSRISLLPSALTRRT